MTGSEGKRPLSARENITGQIPPWELDVQTGMVFNEHSGSELGLRYWLKDASNLTAHDLEEQQATFQTILDSISMIGSRVRFTTLHRNARPSEVMEQQYDDENDPLVREMMRQERERNRLMMFDGQLKFHANYVSVKVPETRRGVGKSFNRQYLPEEYEAAITLGLDERDKISDMLNMARLPTAPVMSEEAMDLMWTWMNYGSSEGGDPPTYDSQWVQNIPDGMTYEDLRRRDDIRVGDLRDQICQSELETPFNAYLRSGDKYIVVMDMLEIGKTGWRGMVDQALAQLSEIDYAYIVDVINDNPVKLKNQLNRVNSGNKMLTSDAMSASLEAQAHAERNEQEMYQMYFNNSQLVRVGMSLILFLNSEQEVYEWRRKVQAIWRNLNRTVLTFGNNSNYKQYTQRLFPLGGGQTNIAFTRATSEVTYYLPYYGPWHNAGDETLAVLENSYNGQTRITLPDRKVMGGAVAMVGTTGAGKTFLIQYISSLLYLRRSRIRFIDLKSDYKPLVKFLRGSYIKCAPGALLEDGVTPVRFNIFKPRPHPLGVTDREDILGFLKSLWDDDAGPMSKDHQIVLRSAVDDFARARVEQNADGTSYYSGGYMHQFVDYLHDLDKVGRYGADEKKREAARDLAYFYQEFTGNTAFGLMFDGDETVDLEARVIGFDLSELEGNDRMKNAMMSIINAVSWQAAVRKADRSIRDVLVNEELGALAKVPEIVNMVNRNAMVGRAYNFLQILVAQNTTSIKNLGGVVNNITRLICGSMGADEADATAHIFGMNSEQRASLTTLTGSGNHRDYFVFEKKRGDLWESGVVRFTPTAIHKALFSSDDEAYMAREEALRRTGGNLARAIELLVSGQVR